jgi:hypothetical protein
MIVVRRGRSKEDRVEKASKTVDRVSIRRVAALASVVVLATIATGAPMSADAQQERPGRFTMSPTEGGFVRLDTETGAMALCARRAEAWSCAPIGDTAAADREALAKLQTENAELRATVKQLEEMLGVTGDKPAGNRSAEKQQGLRLPSEKEVDEALDYVDRMFKKFRDRLKQLDCAPAEKGTPL